MVKKWELLNVGLRRPEWVGMEECLTIQWTDESGLVLFVFLDKPSDKEITEMSAEHRFEIAFKDVQGIGFFSVKFGVLPWYDCSFSPNLYDTTPEFGAVPYALHIMLVDVSIGELLLMRTVGLGSEFSIHFRQWARQSLERNVGRRLYDRVVKQAFVDYPTAESLAKNADIRWAYPTGANGQRREVPREHRGCLE